MKFNSNGCCSVLLRSLARDMVKWAVLGLKDKVMRNVQEQHAIISAVVDEMLARETELGPNLLTNYAKIGEHIP